MFPHEKKPNVNPIPVKVHKTTRKKFRMSKAGLMFFLLVGTGVTLLAGSSFLTINFVENLFILTGISLIFLGYINIREDVVSRTIRKLEKEIFELKNQNVVSLRRYKKSHAEPHQ